MRVKDIKDYFIDAYRNASNIVPDKTGVKTLELVGASFIADEPTIFGQLNVDYIQRELKWYKSQSLSVHDIPGEVPQIWKDVSDHEGYINSNYGYLIYSRKNYQQFDAVIEELALNPNSRRAVMIYNRPSMHEEYDNNGMNDFICTNAVQYMIRNNQLHAVVQMRSNDVIFGYRNDYAWQRHVLDEVIKEYNIVMHNENNPVTPGNITWQVGSLHVYERHFKFIEAEIETKKL